MIVKRDNLYLAGGDGWSSPSGLSHNARVLVQEARRPRAVAVELFARGNLSNTIRFSTTREFPSLQDAFAYFLDHTDASLAQGNVLLSETVSDRTVTRYLANAVVHTAATSIAGVRVDCEIEIQGGAFVKEIAA